MKSPARVQPKSQRQSGANPKPQQTVRSKFTDPAARKVCVAGSFNNWNPEASRMVKLDEDRWAKDLPLAPGVYEYRFVVDGTWIADPDADYAVINPHGERNSVVTVSARDGG